jgi:hypothetical protein
VGLRYDATLAGHWSYEIAADVSSGDTDFTWSVNPSLGYTFGQRQQYQVIAGYRHLVVQFDTAPAVDVQMTLSGFLAGFRFNF